jgi:type VI secretion system protein VasJ
MFPPKGRERARVQALDWLSVHAARTLPETVPADSGPAVLSAAADAAAIEDLFAAKLTKEQVSLGDLVRGLRPLADAARQAEADRAAQAERAAAPPPEPVAPPPQPPPAAGPSPAPAARAPTDIAPVSIAVAADAGIDKALAGVQTGVRQVALSILKADLREARAYALLRAVTWIEIVDAPPSQGGKTPLGPPPAMRLAEFNALQAANNGPDLVLGLESFMSGPGLFWLDGQRIVHQALLGMGPGYAAAARAVARGVALMVERLPFLPSLSFQDGTPFADTATQGWIEREASLSSGAASGPAEAAAWTEGLEAARALVQEGNLEQALALLAEGGAAAPSGRAQFRWRLALARLCLDAGHTGIALPILRQASVDAAAIEAWEPEAAGEAALLLHRCLTTPGARSDFDAAEQSREVAVALSVLARIDPVNAIRALRVST